MLFRSVAHTEAGIPGGSFTAPCTEPSFVTPAGPSIAPFSAIPGLTYGHTPTDQASFTHPSVYSDVFPAYAPVSPDQPDLTYGSSEDTAGLSAEHVLAYVDGAPIVQGACRTPWLVGTSVVSVSCFDLDGRPALLGIFHVGDLHCVLRGNAADTETAQDLAVNVTGKIGRAHV